MQRREASTGNNRGGGPLLKEKLRRCAPASAKAFVVQLQLVETSVWDFPFSVGNFWGGEVVEDCPHDISVHCAGRACDPAAAAAAQELRKAAALLKLWKDQPVVYQVKKLLTINEFGSL